MPIQVGYICPFSSVGIEHLTTNQKVGSSSLSTDAKRHIQQILLITRLVQMVERKHVKFEVTGSSPVFCTKSNCVLNMGLLV